MSDQALPANATAALPRLRIPRGGALLSIGTLASGVLAYVFNLLAARALGPEAYGPVAVLWATMFLVSVVLFRPAEQTLARTIAERRAHGQDALGVARAVAWLAFGALVAITVVVVAAWGPITDKLFAGRDLMTASLLAATIGYALSYYIRGLASGLQWLGGYGFLLLIDGAARVALALPLVLVASPAIAAAAMVAAAVLGGVAPLVARRVSPSALLGRLRGLPAPGLEFRAAVAFAAPVAIIAGAEQVLVSGGALLAVLGGGSGASAAAGTVFAATMLVRAPVFLFQGVAAALLPRFTQLHARGDQAAIRRELLKAGLGLTALTAVLVAGALICGPELMRLLFGPGFDVARTDLAVLSGGVGCYLAGATLSQAALARGLAARAASAWFTSTVAFVGIELVLSGDSLHRVSVAFTLATALNAMLLALVIRTAQD